MKARMILSIAAVWILPTTVAATPFEDLGLNLFPDGCTPDGDTVVGTSTSTGQAFLWTASGGVELIGGLEGSGITDDGQTVVGTIDDGGLQTAARWNRVDGWTSLGLVPGGASCDAFLSSAWGVDGDGSAIVGLGWVPGCRAHAIAWEESTGWVDLGSTVADRSSRANNVSADGTVIVGWQDASDGFRQGAIWVDGVQTLLVDASSIPVGEAQAATPDGSVVVGGSTATSDAYRWIGGSAVESIGGLAGFNWRSSATDVSDDGSVIVGWSGFGGDRAAFIWIEGAGLQRLDDYLAAEGITGAEGWTLATATGVSADGRVIVGWGFDPSFAIRGFRVDLDAVVSVGDVSVPPVDISRMAPNPTRAGAEISYVLAEAGRVSLGVYDVAGRRHRTLIDRVEDAGARSVVWNGLDDRGRSVSPGVYFVRVSTTGLTTTRRLTVLP